jgi:hypothetical protein
MLREITQRSDKTKVLSTLKFATRILFYATGGRERKAQNANTSSDQISKSQESSYRRKRTTLCSPNRPREEGTEVGGRRRDRIDRVIKNVQIHSLFRRHV